MEKTFDELIEPLKIGGFEGWYSVEFISTGKVKELLQQVRESTIEECVEILTNPNIPKSRMAALKTDRIKLTDENRKGN